MEYKKLGRPAISEELKGLVIELYEKDMKISDIVKACKVSRASVFRIIKQRRLENEPQEK